jgi:tetratricopeptide (TPR) repeat protein
MGGTPYDPAKFEESKSYHKKHIEIKPDDPEPYYWIGVIDWAMANRVNLELRAQYNKDHLTKQVKETEPLPAAVRPEYVSKVAPLVEEGITSLEKAIQIRPDYEDAMAYLSLLLRRKADMSDSAEERDKLQKQADDLLDKVKEIKQKRASQPQPAA